MLLKFIHSLIPLLIEVVEFHDMGLFKLKTVVLLSDVQFIKLFLLLLSLQLSDSIFGHLSFNVFTVVLTFFLMLSKDFNEVINVILFSHLIIILLVNLFSLRWSILSTTH